MDHRKLGEDILDAVEGRNQILAETLTSLDDPEFVLIIKAHILMDGLLTKILNDSLPTPSAVDLPKMQWGTKLAWLRALHSKGVGDLEQLKLFGKVRNLAAHDLKSEDYKRARGNFIRHFLKQQKCWDGLIAEVGEFTAAVCYAHTMLITAHEFISRSWYCGYKGFESSEFRNVR